ncbi:MAG TPA: RidA family protein [Hyphomicrobiaceae bacterium]|nr:RidA family protein [Hyphomicrobiaceae bacterium]
MRMINPETIAKPASSYSQGIVHGAGPRLVISGQVGVAADGKIESGIEAQMRRAWSNFTAVVKAAGFEPHHVVKVTVFCTLPGQVGLFRRLRDEALLGHKATATYLQVAGLATPEYLVEIEGEAVKD